METTGRISAGVLLQKKKLFGVFEMNVDHHNRREGRSTFLDQFKNLLKENRIPEALASAQERLKQVPVDADAYLAAGEALVAMNLQTQSRRMLQDLECHVSALSDVLIRMRTICAEKGDLRFAGRRHRQPEGLNFSDKPLDSSHRAEAVLEDITEMEGKHDHPLHSASSDHLIRTLSGWLANIHRTKMHAADHR